MVSNVFSINSNLAKLAMNIELRDRAMRKWRIPLCSSHIKIDNLTREAHDQVKQFTIESTCYMCQAESGDYT